jgi:RES domain-containing protein
MIIAWRLVHAMLAADAFSGEGARTNGGRWNHEGTPVVYVSGSISLAALELFVHLGEESRDAKYVCFEVRIPEDVKVERLTGRNLPGDWRSDRIPVSTRNCGTKWARELTTAVLRVPSVVVPMEFNYVLNPVHPDFTKLQIGKAQPFSFDRRMWKK